MVGLVVLLYLVSEKFCDSVVVVVVVSWFSIIKSCRVCFLGLPKVLRVAGQTNTRKSSPAFS